MLAAVPLVLLLLGEVASFTMLPPPGAMLRPQLSCKAPTGGIWPGPGGRGVGLVLRTNAAYVATRRSGRSSGVALGAVAVSFEESKRQTGKIQNCTSVRELAEFVAEYGGRFNHVNVNVAWQRMAR